MFYTIAEDLILYQLLTFVRKFKNYELKLRNYFYSRTDGIYPEFIVVINQFIFFFVKKENYFDSKMHLDAMRREFSQRKILIIRIERILLNLLFSFFPDLNIDTIKIESNNKSVLREISIYFLFRNERGIAIGRNGDYIKAVNEIFKKYVIFENRNTPLEVKCKVKE